MADEQALKKGGGCDCFRKRHSKIILVVALYLKKKKKEKAKEYRKKRSIQNPRRRENNASGFSTWKKIGAKSAMKTVGCTAHMTNSKPLWRSLGMWTVVQRIIQER